MLSFALNEAEARKMTRRQYKQATSYLRLCRRVIEGHIDPKELDKGIEDFMLFGQAAYQTTVDGIIRADPWKHATR